jgi:hypothetical protein
LVLEGFSLELNIIMGCVNDKDSNNPIEPSIMVGSTMLRADQMVVIGDSVFLKTRDENGEYKVVEIGVDDKKSLVIKD